MSKSKKQKNHQIQAELANIKQHLDTINEAVEVSSRLLLEIAKKINEMDDFDPTVRYLADFNKDNTATVQ